MKRFALLAAAFLFPLAALAGPAPYHATLVKPIATSRGLIIGGTMWHCTGSSCQTTSQPEGVGTIPACHSLALQVGPISAYGTKAHPFDVRSLAKCNAH
ncbi:MAG: hypothetical protein KGO02_02295 [Alphaproteobacteria bacterium]|nr:hypothetical protein [Alphaproteobacteria bacterium]